MDLVDIAEEPEVDEFEFGALSLLGVEDIEVERIEAALRLLVARFEEGGNVI